VSGSGLVGDFSKILIYSGFSGVLHTRGRGTRIDPLFLWRESLLVDRISLGGNDAVEIERNIHTVFILLCNCRFNFILYRYIYIILIVTFKEIKNIFVFIR
jgi:hypothetical protein